MEGDDMIQKRAEREYPTNKTIRAGRVAVGIGAIAVFFGILTAINILPASIFIAIIVAAVANLTSFGIFADISASFSSTTYFHPVIAFIVIFTILAFIAISSFAAFSFALHPIYTSSIAAIASGLAASIAGLVIIYSQQRK
jgi:hypothetical protein